jgi:hypothetical protein
MDNMKIAVLFCGEYRQFDIAIKSFDFLNDLDCDYYFSTWNISTQKNVNLNIDITESITEEMILDYLPNVDIDIVDLNSHPNLDSNTKKMIFHWKNALRMVRDSGKDYDIILLTRPDSFLRINFPVGDFNQMTKKDRIYGIDRISLVGNNTFTMDDTFIVGNSEIIGSFVDTLTLGTHMHQGFAKTLMDMGLFVDRLEMGCAIIRANCRDMFNPCFLTISEKRQEWFNSFHSIKNII